MIRKSLYNFSILLCCCVFFILVVPATGQICTSSKLVRITYEVPDTYSHRVNYHAECWYGSCRKTKWNRGIRMRTLSRMDIQHVEECCDGYYKDTENVMTSLNCKPICEPNCHNGYCKSPGDCACNDGYEKDPTNSYSCSPIKCSNCDHGRCVAPNKCECDAGYYYRMDHCYPYCSNCDLEYCTAPGVCECPHGYTKINEKCTPDCNPECRNGTCTAPGVCSCEEDYELINNTCEPICESPCGNGTCVEPDICECFEGYSASSNCDPECCKPKCGDCGKGFCLEPRVCLCEPGLKNENGSCVPECRFDCGHGICISPDRCECDPGYNDTRYGTDNQTVCEPICQNCEGICAGPDICVCNYPLEAKNVTSGGEDCDCFYDCSRICDKTICVSEKSQYVTVSSIELLHTDVATLGIITTEGGQTDLNKTKDHVAPDKEHTATESTTTQGDGIYNKDYLSNKTVKQTKERDFPVWLYGVIPLLSLVLLALVVFVIVKRGIISKYFRRNGGSYEVEDHLGSL